MDEEIEQFLGIYGILQQTYKFIRQSTRIFTHITLAFILPLSLLSNSLQFLKLLDLVSSKTNHHLLLNFVFSIFSSILSLLITYAIVYTIAAGIYIARDVSNFKHVMRVLPKVWNQILVMFLVTCAALIALGFITYTVLRWMPVIEILINHKIGIFFLFVMFYLMGIWYLVITLQLSRMVVKPSVWLNLPLGKVKFELYWFVGRPVLVRVVGRGESFILWGLLCLLVEFVAEIVVYFVCKWCHCESVHKLPLSDHFYGHLSPNYVGSDVHNVVHQSSASQIATCSNDK